MNSSTKLFCTLLLIAASVTNAVAQNEPGPPVPIAEAKTKTGGFQVTLTDRSPLSVLKDVGKRAGIKPADLGVDYDLSKETFYMYVPTEAGDGGKYGLMVGLCFKEYGHPALAWPAVLDQKHCIWIGAVGNGDERPAAQRIGLLLDAVANVQKNWAIDSDRIYLSMNAGKGPALGTAFYYPDVFAGMLGSYRATWFMKLPGLEHPPMIWNSDDFSKPAAKQMDLDRSQSRFFQANRDSPEMTASNDTVQKHGYGSAGFKYVKFIKVPQADMGHYINYTGDWFAEGIDFLDEPLAKIRAARVPHVKPKTNPLKPAGN